MKNLLLILCYLGVHTWKYKIDGTKKKCVRCRKRVPLLEKEPFNI
jgi:hypothetical protein